MRPAEGRMIAAGDKLTIAVGLCPADLNFVILQYRAEGIVELHRPAAAAEFCLGHPCPGIGMAENCAVFFEAGIHPCHKADPVIGLCVAGGIEHQAVLRIEVFIDTVHGLKSLLSCRRTRNHRPGVGLHMDASLPVGLCPDPAVVGGDPAKEPFSVPQHIPADLLHLFRRFAVMRRVFRLSQEFGQLTEVVQGPEMQKAHHRAFSPAQIQAVVPVGAKPLADSVLPHLALGEVQYALQMLVYRPFAAVRVSERLLQKVKLAGLPDVLYHRTDQP